MPDRFYAWCGFLGFIQLVFSITEAGSISNGLKGRLQTCSKEGEILSVSQITRGQIPDDPCMHCVCQNSAVVCIQETCENVRTCPVVERLSESEEKIVCCRKCKGCSYIGQNYENDDHWGSFDDACRTLTCKGGVVTIARMHCVTPCSNPQRMTGYCCPLCPLANTTTDIVLDGAELAVLSDPCVRCQCGSFWCHCYRTACPALDCEKRNQHLAPGRCCPECLSPTKEVKLGGGRCLFKQVKYEHQQSFRPDPCTLCKCQDGSIICQRFVCPVVRCSKERLYYDPRLCCPRCRDRDPLGCTYINKKYNHGDAWDLDACTKCKCTNGETKCVTQPCQYAHGCPAGYRLKKVPGKCCPECEEKEAICTVFGDPHYRTFDGRQYSFQGTCKYLLTQDCIFEERQKEPSFVVIAQNDPFGSVGYSWTRHITVRLPKENIRISLLRGKRVKENGRRKRLPHVRLGVYSAMVDKDRNVVLRVSSVGLKVVWGRRSYVEIAASAKYKGRLCGLCGNYNHDISDDFTKSDGSLSHSVNRFAQSWRFGSWKKCRSEKDRVYHKTNLLRRKKNRRKERRRQKERNLLIAQLIWHRVANSVSSEEGAGGFLNGVEKLDSEQILSSQELQNSTSKSSPSERKSQRSSKTVSQSAAKKKFRRRSRLRKLCSGGSSKWRTRKMQIKQCRLLKSRIFSKCRETVKVGTYFRWCIEDACACPQSGKCHCESLMAYARSCEEEANILVDWRQHSSCVEERICPMEGGLFSSCAPSPECVSSCDKNSIDISCSSSCVPGCVCPPDTVLHENKCIPAHQCP